MYLNTFPKVLVFTKEIDIVSHCYGHDVVRNDVTFKRLVGPDKLPCEWSLANGDVPLEPSLHLILGNKLYCYPA